MKLTDYLRPECIETGIKARSKEELLDQMVEIAARNPSLHDKEAVKNAILEREQIMSTGVGHGCAIPHGKSDGVSDIVLAFAVTAEPVEYMSLDNNPVRLVLLMIRRESDRRLRLVLLSRASKILNSESARKAFLKAKSRSEILKIFRIEEEKIDNKL
ncbi:MAG TPA: PTS sugar transporter subunit IIA [Candidatus Kapabacteria bacterium]|nr:PTS sugar transporter subunit IIA [Candidatus Kapabacteria bacterium]